MRNPLRIALVAAAGLAVLVTARSAAAGQPAEPDKVKRAYAFVLEDQHGKKVVMSKFRGQVVVLEWVNFDCPFSRRHHEQGTFRQIYKKYKYGVPGAKPEPAPPQRGRRRPRGPKQKVVWLAINSNHYANVEQNKAAAAKYNVPYPVLDDHLGRVGLLYGAKTTPHIMIKAPDGTLAYQGAVDDDPKGEKEEPLNYVAEALEEILTGKPVSTPETTPYGTSIAYAAKR